MTPKEIARVITEDLRVNNGLIMEAAINVNQINRAESYPFIVGDGEGGIVFPTNPDREGDTPEAACINRRRNRLHNIYGLLMLWIETSDGKAITIECEDGSFYPDRPDTDNTRICLGIRDVGDQGNAVLVNVARAFSYTKGGVQHRHDIKRLCDLSSIEMDIGPDGMPIFRNNTFNPLRWDDAMQVLQSKIKKNEITDVIERKRPKKVFGEDYWMIRNKDNNTVLLVSGRYAEGLYIINQKIEIDGQRIDWQDAVNIFGANPGQYVDPATVPAGAANRSRLLFRKFIEATGQGHYIDRVKLSPENIIDMFIGVRDVEDFKDRYRPVAAAVEELIRELKSRSNTIVG